MSQSSFPPPRWCHFGLDGGVERGGPAQPLCVPQPGAVQIPSHPQVKPPRKGLTLLGGVKVVFSRYSFWRRVGGVMRQMSEELWRHTINLMYERDLGVWENTRGIRVGDTLTLYDDAALTFINLRQTCRMFDDCMLTYFRHRTISHMDEELKRIEFTRHEFIVGCPCPEIGYPGLINIVFRTIMIFTMEEIKLARRRIIRSSEHLLRRVFWMDKDWFMWTALEQTKELKKASTTWVKPFFEESIRSSSTPHDQVLWIALERAMMKTIDNMEE